MPKLEQHVIQEDLLYYEAEITDEQFENVRRLKGDVTVKGV